MPLKQRARYSPRSIVGQDGEGVAQLGDGVSPWSLFCCLRISVAGGAKKHQTAVIFCVSVASYLPARVQIAAPICAAGPVALLASGRCVSTSVISRLAPGVW